MDDQLDIAKGSKTMVYRYHILAVVTWTLLIAASVYWNISHDREQVIQLAKNTAKAYFKKDLALRLWASEHGGIYVPRTDDTIPNRYMQHVIDRDIQTLDGRKLTLMNHAYMITQMTENYSELFGVSSRMVANVVLNPENKADEFESNAIEIFKSGEIKEIAHRGIFENKDQLRVVRPFIMEQSCVKCHGDLGFDIGDVRGLAEILIPLKPYQKLGEEGIRSTIYFHIVIYIIGLVGLLFSIYRAAINFREREKFTLDLYRINLTLDQKVKSRTIELEESLEKLKKTQSKLIETEKMSSLGSLVAGVSHEINTPLGISITGITHIQSENQKILELMNEGKLGKNALSQYLTSVDEMSESMFLSLRSAADLIRSFKQVAIDQHVEEKRLFNLRSYCNEVLLSLNNQLKLTNIRVQNLIEESIEINTFAGVFSQMWTNFIMNSLIHGYGNNKVEGTIVIKGWVESDILTLVYEDDGVGIDKELHNKIFDPFFTTKLGKGGSGLGLNIIYNLIIHKLNGNIRCENNQPNGIKMIVDIPMGELL